jgi:hypothetical protein
VPYSRLPLAALMEDMPTDFERVFTGDESWFFQYYPYDELSHRIKQKITQKNT